MNTAFAHILQQNRAAFNAQFAQARQSAPSLDGDEFLAHLGETVAPIVAACEATKPECTAEIVETLYEISLQLMSKGLLGSRSRNVLVARAWTKLLPACAKIVVLAPRQIVGSVSNALWQLSQTRGANGERWLGLMHQIADMCSDAPTFLAAGRVAAWRCGLATSRDAAIQAGRDLPPEIARVIFGLVDDVTPARIEAMWMQLQNDIWFFPSETAGELAALTGEEIEILLICDAQLEKSIVAKGENANAQAENAQAATSNFAENNNAEADRATSSTRSLKLVARVGDFGGFGGEFSAPPLVALVDDTLRVFENGQSWRLFADAFGATTVRGANERFPIDRVPVEPWKRVLEVLPEAKNITSLAFDGRTIALTLPTSHRVWLFA